MLFQNARQWLRMLVYPGLDLHTRNRASIRRFWRTGARDVLDAGSGNGYLSWLAYKSGARVVAMNYEQGQVDKAKEFFLEFRKADPQRLRFECRNLYDLAAETRTFDEIICLRSPGAPAARRRCVERVSSPASAGWRAAFVLPLPAAFAPPGRSARPERDRRACPSRVH